LGGRGGRAEALLPPRLGLLLLLPGGLPCLLSLLLPGLLQLLLQGC
jgi:hypothetical protein